MDVTATQRRLDVESFLFHEAELLDNWKLPEWTKLYSDDAHYEITSLSAADPLAALLTRNALTYGVDVLPVQLVTMGRVASEHSQRLFAGDRYSEYLYFHGLSVETAEALAEFWHQRIRRELGIDGDDAADIKRLFAQGYRGSRYSFGYPACPNLEDQEILFRLIDPSTIGVTLSEEHQLDPEQSTSAIVAHHPDARYFVID